MKRFILILTLILCNLISAQSRIEKYNSIMERYEYFDNYGNMTGYKKYNSIMQQWEYFNTTKQNSREKQEYIEPYDFELINKALANRQNKYESNQSKIRSKIDHLNNVFQLLSDYKNASSVSKRWSTINSLNNSFADGIDKINNMKLDFSNNSTAYEVLNWIAQYETRLTTIMREIKQEN